MDRCVSRSLSLSNSDFNVWLCLADARESRMDIDLIFDFFYSIVAVLVHM